MNLDTNENCVPSNDDQDLLFDRCNTYPFAPNKECRHNGFAFGDILKSIKRNKISHKTKKPLISEWFLSLLPGSNQRPTDYKSVALPAELKRPFP